MASGCLQHSHALSGLRNAWRSPAACVLPCRWGETECESSPEGSGLNMFIIFDISFRHLIIDMSTNVAAPSINRNHPVVPATLGPSSRKIARKALLTMQSLLSSRRRCCFVLAMLTFPPSPRYMAVLLHMCCNLSSHSLQGRTVGWRSR